MYNTFNMGVGMCVIVSKEDVENTLSILRANGDDAYVIGEIVAAPESGEKVILC
jgi:phosphoribosylformylglycinamidine cyclo-ligase